MSTVNGQRQPSIDDEENLYSMPPSSSSSSSTVPLPSSLLPVRKKALQIMSISPNLIKKHQKHNVTVCYNNYYIISKGVFLGDTPLEYSVPLVVLDMSIMFLVTNATHYILKKVGMHSRFVAELLAGIILGPSVLGKSEGMHNALFPPWVLLVLDTVSLVSLIFFMFVVGVKTNLSFIRHPGKHSLAIGSACSLLPIALCYSLFFLLRPSFPENLRDGPLFFFVTARLSLTSFPVLSAALDEIQLLNSELGRIAMSAALFTDIADWIISTFVTSVTLISKAKTPAVAFGIMASMAAIVIFVLLVVRPLVLWAVRRTPAGETLVEWHFTALLLMTLMMSFACQSLGFTVGIGPFLMGLALPGGMPVGQTLMEKLEPLCMGLFLPIYLVLAGYRTNLNEMTSAMEWGVIELVVVVCLVSKFIGAVAMSRYLDMSTNDALLLGLMLNIKGIVEVATFNSYAGDSQIATVEHFSVLIVSMMLITAGATLLIKLLYNPKMHYVARKRRTIEHSIGKSFIRLMVCVHDEDHVTPLLSLLESTYGTPDSPIALTLLLLNDLIGHSAAVLRPYREAHQGAIPTAIDRIVNAFRYLERRNTTERDALSLHPFVAMAPFSSMYNDVCFIALDRKISLILLPFHKSSDGAQQKVNHALQSLNRNVLAYSPCSVAILVDHRLPTVAFALNNQHLLDAAVYFIGGPDDREALAFGSRMTTNPSVGLTVVRFIDNRRGAENGGQDERERALDDAAVERLRQRPGDNEKLEYVEKSVVDSEGLLSVIRGMTEHFDLLIVGRRKGFDSDLTKGLSERSECPELGFVGEYLSLADFTEKVSILVVQQQKHYRSGDTADDDDGDMNNEQGEADRPK